MRVLTILRRGEGALQAAMLIALLVMAAAPTAAASPWLTSTVDLTRFLPPPPAPGSAADARDMAAVLEAQSERTAAQAAEARLDQDVSVARFADVLGPGLTAERVPRTFKLLRQACREASSAVAAAKKHWQRPRPFVVNRHVRPVLTVTTEGSYPSGHAACGYLMAVLLADMFPERRDVLFARGVRYGENRVVGGVHYPSDVEAGRVSAVVIGVRLLESAAFREDLDAARAEARAALKTTPDASPPY